MKPIISIFTILILLVFSLLNTGCHKSETVKQQTGCDSTNTDFSQLYNSLQSSVAYSNDTAFDGEVHSYTFQVTSPEIICKIGYENLSPINTQPYLIEIYDSSSNALLYSGSHYFLTTGMSYISINPIMLTIGNSYTIRRIQHLTTNTLDMIGRICRNANGTPISFPITFGNFQITGTACSTDVNYPLLNNNYILPYIDIVFQ